MKKENKQAQHTDTKMKQPYSRGSPRPRGYIHQIYLFFYFFI